MSKNTKKDEIIGQIIINLYEDTFEVLLSDNVDLFTVYATAAGIMEYLEEVSEDLERVEKIRLQ